jgi:hypothetical protein
MDFSASTIEPASCQLPARGSLREIEAWAFPVGI